MSDTRRPVPLTGFYFVPDELIFRVEHSPIAPADLANDITIIVNSLLNELRDIRPAFNEFLRTELVVNPDNIITLNPDAEITRSLAWVSVSKHDLQYIAESRIEVETINRELIEVVEAIIDRIRNGNPITQGNTTLRTVCPNWYSTGAPPTLTGTGGPGARPVPPDPATMNPPPYRFRLEETNSSIIRSWLEDSPSSDNPVQVFILDTAPRNFDCGTTSCLYPDNVLLNALCGDIPVNIHYFDDVIQPGQRTMDSLDRDLFGTMIDGHEYNMGDHGLFIAGIIKSIAPNAEIHIVQVLNQYGVGTLQTIAKGVEYALKNRAVAHPPMIVNCSFTIEMPLLMTVTPPDPNTNSPQRIYYGHQAPRLTWPDLGLYIGDFADCIQQIFARMIEDDTSISVIAAAGNDYRADMGHRPQSRLPARLDGVIGVAALNNHQPSLTEYSNYADNPLEDGIAVFGGNVNPLAPYEADTTEGILGVYTGKFPDGTNSGGWARWAGTSFATPIIAGLLALVCAATGRDVKYAEGLIRQASNQMQPSPYLIVDQY